MNKVLMLVAGLLAAVIVGGCATDALSTDEVLKDPCTAQENYDYEETTTYTGGPWYQDEALVLRDKVRVSGYDLHYIRSNVETGEVAIEAIHIFLLGSFKRSTDDYGTFGEWQVDYIAPELALERKRIVDEGIVPEIATSSICQYRDLEEVKLVGNKTLENEEMKVYSATQHKYPKQWEDDYRDLEFWIDTSGKLRRLYIAEYTEREEIPLEINSAYIYSDYGVPNEIIIPFGPPTRVD